MPERQSLLSSPRFVNRLMWAGSLVFVAGVVTFAVVMFGADKSSTPEDAAGDAPPAATQTTAARRTVPLDPQAQRIAGEFILSAVTREDLAKGWTLLHPDLRAECGCTRKEWMTGNIPIQPYPAQALDDATFAIDESYEDEVVLQVALLPKEGSDVPSEIFYIGLKKAGDGKAKRWLVYYWAPRPVLEVPVPE